MKYSLQLYTLRTPLEQDLAGTIKKVAEIGFTLVEPYNFTANADELSRTLQENGLSAPSGHAPLLGQDQDRIFTAARTLGIRTVIEPYRPAGHWQSEEDIQATAALLNAAARKGSGYGIRVGYHNHHWELEAMVKGRTALEYLAGLLDPELVLEVDTYWVAVGGHDPVEVLNRLGDRARFIHIKDGPLTTDTMAQLPAGRGGAAVRDIIAAASSAEVGVIEFDDYAGDIFEGVAESLAFLAGTGTKGVGA